jgi:hypothetical protein
MENVSLSVVGSLVVVHRDEPSEAEVRRRLRLLLMGRLPRRGLVEAWAGDEPDEVRWRKVA